MERLYDGVRAFCSTALPARALLVFRHFDRRSKQQSRKRNRVEKFFAEAIAESTEYRRCRWVHRTHGLEAPCYVGSDTVRPRPTVLASVRLSGLLLLA